jgi:hypothetical protein
VPGWVSAPQAHSRVSNINFDIEKKFMEGGSLLISHEKYIKDGKVLDHLGCQSNVFLGNISYICTSWDIYRDPLT